MKRISMDEYLEITRRFVQGQGKVGVAVKITYLDGGKFQSPIINPDSGVSNEPDEPARSPCCQDILDHLEREDRRQTTNQMVNAIGGDHSQSTIQKALVAMKAAGELTNKVDARGKGYGLPEWD